MHDTGYSKPVLWDNLKGWDGEGGGRGVWDGGHMYTHGLFMSINVWQKKKKNTKILQRN